MHEINHDNGMDVDVAYVASAVSEPPQRRLYPQSQMLIRGARDEQIGTRTHATRLLGLRMVVSQKMEDPMREEHFDLPIQILAGPFCLFLSRR